MGDQGVFEKPLQRMNPGSGCKQGDQPPCWRNEARATRSGYRIKMYLTFFFNFSKYAEMICTSRGQDEPRESVPMTRDTYAQLTGLTRNMIKAALSSSLSIAEKQAPGSRADPQLRKLPSTASPVGGRKVTSDAHPQI